MSWAPNEPQTVEYARGAPAIIPAHETGYLMDTSEMGGTENWDGVYGAVRYNDALGNAWITRFRMLGSQHPGAVANPYRIALVELRPLSASEMDRSISDWVRDDAAD